MTAPSPRVTLTPEIYAYFTAYVKKNESWGIYHVALADGNYKCGAGPLNPQEFAALSDEDKQMVHLFDLMTPSQRARIAKRCS